MTNKRISIIFYLLVFSVLFFQVGNIYAGEKGTIITKNGISYENVEYKIDKVYKTIQIKLDDGETKKNISFTDIETVYNSIGENITPEVLGKWYNPSSNNDSQETEPLTPATTPPEVDTKSNEPAEIPAKYSQVWLSEESETYKEARKKTWNVCFRLGGTYSIPVGTWFNGINSGIGYETTMMIAINHNLGLRFDFSHSGLNADDDYIEFISYDPNFSIIDQKTSFSVTRYYASFMYYSRFGEKRESGRPLFLFWTGLGAATHKTSYEGTLVNHTTNKRSTNNVSDTMSKFALHNGIGLISMISKKVGFDASASFDLLFIGKVRDNSYSGYGTQEAVIFDLKIGLVFLL